MVLAPSFDAVLIEPDATVVLPITMLAESIKVTPSLQEMTKDNIPAPPREVFSVPVEVPCVTIAPALSVIVELEIAIVHSLILLSDRRSPASNGLELVYATVAIPLLSTTRLDTAIVCFAVIIKDLRNSAALVS
tara:strand:- start:216 stop:617 length:402 start_codon:yes stop_codon:yes gene_type:complete